MHIIIFLFQIIISLIGFFSTGYQDKLNKPGAGFTLLKGLYPPNQPETREEAQQRINFTIYRPTYKPKGVKERGSLTLFGLDKYARLSYQSDLEAESPGPVVQVNETRATDSLKEHLTASSSTKITPTDVCGLVGFVADSNDSQQLIFNKDNTRILITIFPEKISLDDLHKIGCSMEPIMDMNE